MAEPGAQEGLLRVAVAAPGPERIVVEVIALVAGDAQVAHSQKPRTVVAGAAPTSPDDPIVSAGERLRRCVVTVFGAARVLPGGGLVAVLTLAAVLPLMLVVSQVTSLAAASAVLLEALRRRRSRVAPAAAAFARRHLMAAEERKLGIAVVIHSARAPIELSMTAQTVPPERGGVRIRMAGDALPRRIDIRLGARGARAVMAVDAGALQVLGMGERKPRELMAESARARIGYQRGLPAEQRFCLCAFMFLMALRTWLAA